MNKKHFTAIILAGGSGSRMGSETAKQYIVYKEKPLLYYALRAFEASSVDDIILVCRAGDEVFCKIEIVEKYGFAKVKSVVVGGKERYNSVYEGLKSANCDYVLIHDGARVSVDAETISRCMQEVVEYKACVAAVPVKDTIKIADNSGYVEATPDRSTLWQIQTPQCFEYELVKNAYDTMLGSDSSLNITDDSMVVENYSDVRVHLTMGSYNNIKITTPEDLQFLAQLL